MIFLYDWIKGLPQNECPVWTYSVASQQEVFVSLPLFLAYTLGLLFGDGSDSNNLPVLCQVFVFLASLVVKGYLYPSGHGDERGDLLGVRR
jgi:hypothetical protein